ncbi:hypothetical protein HOLleu_26486 [Holothuria leucospilota]|uniref:Methyltransferase FkbM domain-containing protein n=1 Tax=Holothuria leucospilota TaxID=206669 RepID=A0A9Q1BNY2_HOLLE|nr:hypothetical protein HOLleu_26486 [Holothuria leucospilota]
MTISHAIITRGGWNEDVISMFCHWMSTAPEEAYFVDVGAYVGTVAIGVAACGYSVFAFEPHAANFNFLQESIALNPSYSSQIWPYQKALGNTTGTTCVSASSSDQSNARIVPGRGTSVDYQCPQGIVPITTLDEVTKNFQIWAINIDAQGFDPAVIAGAWKHLSGKTPPRYIRFKVETGMYNWQTLNTELNLEDILRGMQDLGYSLRDEDNDIIVNVKQHLLNVGHFATYMTAVYHGRPEGRSGG